MSRGATIAAPPASRVNLPPGWNIVDGRLTPPASSTARSSSPARIVSAAEQEAAAGILRAAAGPEAPKATKSMAPPGVTAAEWEAARTSVLAGKLPSKRTT